MSSGWFILDAPALPHLVAIPWCLSFVRDRRLLHATTDGKGSRDSKDSACVLSYLTGLFPGKDAKGFGGGLYVW